MIQHGERIELPLSAVHIAAVFTKTLCRLGLTDRWLAADSVGYQRLVDGRIFGTLKLSHRSRM